MAYDHSITYRKKTLINTLHRSRLRKILKILDAQNFKNTYSYLDIGCSNGYLTGLITQRYNFAIAHGMDHNEENLNAARKHYNTIKFEHIDLNKSIPNRVEKYNVITCFETLEHVGKFENAVQRILSFAEKNNSFILISVPIEIGFWGLVKFNVKMLKGYSLKELKKGTTFLSYFSHLITFRNISKFRDDRNGWGTHFGFDYRELDKVLNKNKYEFEAKNYLSTRFYIIQRIVT
jgi:2-polyprenyl-3-methyl-5-hydroxy-6-metoxy-1,4-benzoquinol methylase